MSEKYTTEPIATGTVDSEERQETVAPLVGQGKRMTQGPSFLQEQIAELNRK